MKRLFLAVLLSAFAVGSAMAQETFESKAVGKDGKPLAGAAKTSFMQKCKRAVEVAAVSGGDAAFGIVLFLFENFARAVQRIPLSVVCKGDPSDCATTKSSSDRRLPTFSSSGACRMQ